MKKIIDYIKITWHFYRKIANCSLYHSIKWTIDDVFIDFIAYRH